MERNIVGYGAMSDIISELYVYFEEKNCIFKREFRGGLLIWLFTTEVQGSGIKILSPAKFPLIVYLNAYL